MSVSSREGYFSLFSLSQSSQADPGVSGWLPPCENHLIFFLNGFMKSARSHFGEVKYTAADKQMNHVENEKKWKRQTYEQWANGRALCL